MRGAAAGVGSLEHAGHRKATITTASSGSGSGSVTPIQPRSAKSRAWLGVQQKPQLRQRTYSSSHREAARPSLYRILERRASSESRQHAQKLRCRHNSSTRSISGSKARSSIIGSPLPTHLVKNSQRPGVDELLARRDCQPAAAAGAIHRERQVPLRTAKYSSISVVSGSSSSPRAIACTWPLTYS
jgi:hypothetical protein